MIFPIVRKEYTSPPTRHLLAIFDRAEARALAKIQRREIELVARSPLESWDADARSACALTIVGAVSSAFASRAAAERGYKQRKALEQVVRHMFGGYLEVNRINAREIRDRPHHPAFE